MTGTMDMDPPRPPLTQPQPQVTRPLPLNIQPLLIPMEPPATVEVTAMVLTIF